ncbi:WD40 repeat-like protein [Microstroma glucosiphilum]|uniref:WD40 repeat-like protein n=1 Tax=Pseudomicrostroma glucosiphilum TaxID=1684307 RepID=A0A316TZK2_9BASI|nr:WD40 repeat-like protein [Pseudomicrostroma glucosiphilum]PWN18649.1 WD40 repeat-like protein [Pseudomicrostroma glucosiphilum]
MTSYQTYQPSSSFYTPSHPSSSQRLSFLPPSQASSSSYQHSYQSHSSFLSRLDQIQELGGRAAFRIPDTQRFHRPLVGHAGCVNALCWSESGEMLASGSDDTRVVLWKVGTSHIHPTANERAPQRYLPYSFRAGTGQDRSTRPDQQTTRVGGHEDEDEDNVDGPLHGADYPLLEMGMASVIQTGHTANIFSVAFAPHSSDSRIFTAAGDATMRVFDIGSSSAGMGTRVSHPDGRWYDRFDQGSGGVNCRVLKCHRRRVKRLATENSPDIFLSVGEDGDVRSTDLRTSHICRTNCPRPLLHSFTSLYSLSLSKLQPYLFAVAGESPYTYLYDRRMIGRVIKDEWGMSMTNSDEALLTKCVRRYGLPQGSWDGDCSVQDESARRPMSRTSHITAVKISEHNGNDLIATYSNGAIYRFGIRDEEGGLHHVQDRLPVGWETGSTAAATGGTKASGRERKRGSSSSSSGFPAIPEKEAVHTIPSAGGKTSTRILARPEAQDAARRLPSARLSETTAQMSQGPREQDWRRAFVDEEEEDEDESSSSGSESPTEQEAQGFPLYQQLLADGEAGSLEMSSSSSSSEASLASAQEEEEGDSVEWEDVDSDEQGPSRRRRREPNWFNDPEVDDLVIDSNDDSEDDDSEGDGSDDDAEDDGDGESFSDSEEDSVSSSDPDPDVDDPQYAQNVRQASHNYVPIVYPRNPRYMGHLNSETVKEVNFLGPHDEYIVSGSDDGNFFVWDKASGELLGIWEGDGSVVNVVVPHPTLPVLAVSGIDDTVKLFGPVSRYTAGQSSEKGSKDLRDMSRMADKETIVERNTFRRRRSHGMFGMGTDDDEGDEDEDGLEDEYEREDYLTRSAFQNVLMRASMAAGAGPGGEGGEHPASHQCGPQ